VRRIAELNKKEEEEKDFTQRLKKEG